MKLGTAVGIYAVYNRARSRPVDIQFESVDGMEAGS